MRISVCKENVVLHFASARRHQAHLPYLFIQQLQLLLLMPVIVATAVVVVIVTVVAVAAVRVVVIGGDVIFPRFL